MRYPLDAIFKRLIVHGRLTVRWPDGRLTAYGGQPGPRAAIHLTTRRSVWRLLLDPALAAGETYMDRSMVLEDGSIFELLDIFMTNIAANRSGNPLIRPWNAFRALRRRVDQYNPIPRSMTNVAHHYDLHGRLYSLFLDRDRQYSCGYFRTGQETLEAAQAAKKRHIAAKLCLDRPDLEVLDIGCGWGGMALTLARDFGARVTGITLSREQLAEARARAEREGLADRVTFELRDYRTLDRTFDRIVSVGMFEHVGVNHYRTFFDRLACCLEPGGIALIHAIGRAHGPGVTNPWIAKYIFPGGYCPALSEVMPNVEKSGLLVADIEILRLHYAETLRHWRWRFAANRDTIATLYDDRFCRMFEFYLAAAELSFRREDQMVFQLQLAHRIDAVPVTRDYMQRIEDLAEPSPMSPLSTA